MNLIENSTQLLEFSGSRRVPLILQAEVAECGLASMAMIASFFGHQLDMPAMRKRFSANLKGMNLQHLIELGDSLGLSSRPLKCPLDEVTKLATPCILHWDMNHFVVLTKATKNKMYINDPACGKKVLSLEEFSQHFTGIALELSPTKRFEKKVEKQSMKLSQLWSKIVGLKSALFKLLLLTITLQVFALASPYYMQWIVDEVLISHDQALLTVLAFGFALLTIISMITTVARSWLVLRLSSVMSMQMGGNLLWHLLRLPMSYFETRHVGDIVSRFGSLSDIRERLTTGLVESIVDGLMSIAILAMMLMYSVKLTFCVLAAISLYAIVRFAMYTPLHQATEEVIQNSAKEESNFLENIRGIQTIKLFGHEPQRQSIWQNRYAEVINAEIRIGKLNIGFSSFNKVVFGLENVIVVYLAAMLVLESSLSIGMVLAFVAYKNQFTQSIANFIEQMIQFKMMRLHLDRIADIALSPQEQHREGTLPTACSNDSIVSAEICLENVSFRYSEEQPFIIDNANFAFHSGENIAITGSSGCGKTTLAKLLLGLIQPTSGRILFNGKDIHQLGLKNYRQLIAAVMQDDVLFAGSIADNISFFTPEPNFLKIEKCAQLAAIHQDICQMTMGYNALVGDMGSSLSGGQKQRLLLARALYTDPKILVLDEATSHLDEANEQKISNQVKALNMTRIVIAHRPETIEKSNKVIELINGKLIDVSQNNQVTSVSN